MPTNVAQRALEFASLAPSRPAPLRVVPPAIDLDATQPMALGAGFPAGPETLPMRCLRCQGAVERGTAPVELERDGFTLKWQKVPAWVCKRCELAYFEPGEVESIRDALSALRMLSRA